MSLSSAPSLPHFRPPTISADSKPTPHPTFRAPLQDLFEGDWYLLRSSNPFWKDKRNVRMRYTATRFHIEDQAFYQTMTSDAVKSMDGKDTPSENETGIFTWQGKGLLRIASARWEVLCFTSRPENGDWMLVYAHKSIFTSPAVNLMCRKRGGVSLVDLGHINAWLNGIADDKFQQAVGGMVDIVQQ